MARFENYVFKTDIVHKGIYSKSHFYKGTTLWDELPNDIRIIEDKEQYK